MQQLNHVLQELVNDTKLIQQENEVAIPSLYYSELKSVQNLYRNYAYKNKLKQIEQSDLLMKIEKLKSAIKLITQIHKRCVTDCY